MSDEVRVLTYDDEDLVDIEEEIDLSDIFDDELSGDTIVFDREKLKLDEESEEIPEEEDILEEELTDIKRKKKKHRRSYFFLKLFFLLLGIGCLAAIAFSPLFTIKKIEVEGNKFYTDRQVINMSEAKTGGNLFLNAQKSLIKNNLKDNIYFKSINVRRSIPSTLVIEVVEREELAALIYGDKFIVIDNDREVLRIAKIDPEVTVIAGLTIKRMDIGSELLVEENRVFSDTLATLFAMKDGDFYFKRIEASNTKVSAYINDMMKVEGTSGQLRSAIESGSLQKVVNKLLKSKIRRGTVILGDNDYISFSPAV